MKLIQKTEGVCGGSARIRDTRIPVWLIIEARKMGVSESDMLKNWPSLTEDDLFNAFLYWFLHPEEIDEEIEANRIA